jgi:tRNA modification GTPase
MVSILSPESVEGLRSWIVGQLRDSSAGGREMLASTGARCRDCLASAARSLSDALSLALGGADDTLISLEVRAALENLGIITGQIYTDDILDRIFSRFCIGK